jgi:Reverse transcriptase (RNA-dependent DNA polymerase)
MKWKWEDFSRWFNHDFWRAFRNKTFPIQVPQTSTEKEATVRAVFESIKSARYAPSIPEAEIVMNKGHGVARTIPVFCVEDYLVYYFCIKELEDVISGNRTEHTFGGWSLGGKMRKAEHLDMEFDTGFSTARYAFNPRAWTVAFGEFNSLLFAQLETGTYSHVLQFDLSNFYDCIRLDILERWIREDAPAEKGWIIALLFYFLNQWNRRNTGLHPQGVGLPMDALADCSRLLSNYYLQRYDKFAAALCKKSEACYFRYADDQMLLVNGTEKLETIMLLLTRNLDRYGLRVNQKKVDLWTVNELQKHRCREIQSIFQTKDDTRDPKLVRMFVDAYLKLSDKKLTQTWNRGLPLLNRLLWANIESLPQKLLNKLLTRYTAPSYLLRAEKDKLVRVYELNGKRPRPTDLNSRLIKLGEASMHNAFHHEVLGFARQIKDKDLITFFGDRISEIEEQMDANRVYP